MAHLDEARHAAVSALRDLLAGDQEIERLLLIDDLFGGLRVVAWATANNWTSVRGRIDRTLRDARAIERYWTGEIWQGTSDIEADRLLYEGAWESGTPVDDCPKLRIVDRHRNRGAWFSSSGKPPWPAPSGQHGEVPPIVLFYSFKGGLGRSTALAAFAIQRARLGERVVVIDFDLEAPGVGSLLSADIEGTVASWGVVDYLLERPRGSVDLSDYYHACRRDVVTGPGEILVFPTGQLNADYLLKLARVDLEPPITNLGSHPAVVLLEDIRRELRPDWLLLDARTGLSEPAGLLLAGIAHLHVLFGTASNQSWQGLRWVIHRLGASHVEVARPQAECILVQSMIPRIPSIFAAATADFNDRARSEFVDHYYSEDPEDPTDESLWYVRDAEGEDAPHASVPLSYDPRFAHFRVIDEIANDLATTPEYQMLAERISNRFLSEAPE